MSVFIAADDAGIFAEIVINERGYGEQGVHGVNTRHTVFEVLQEPFLAQATEFIIVAEGDEEAGEHKKYRYADVELAEKALQDVRERAVENVAVMRNENEVGGHCAHACKCRNIVGIVSFAQNAVFLSPKLNNFRDSGIVIYSLLR